MKSLCDMVIKVSNKIIWVLHIVIFLFLNFKLNKKVCKKKQDQPPKYKQE